MTDLHEAARRALASLDELIADSRDPGVEALGACHELQTALIEAPSPPADPFCGSSFAPGPHPSHRYMRGGKGYTCPGRTGPAGPSAPADADLRDRMAAAIEDVFDRWRDGLGAQRPEDAICDAVLAVLPSSAYRSLLARLEADRAGHLRATVRARAEGADEVLVAVGGAFASAFRHATAMAVAEFEGPDAAQAYMQRTEGGEGPPFDAQAGLQRLADDPQYGETGDGRAEAATEAERRERYAVAIHDAMESDLSLTDQEPRIQALFACAAEAAVAIADTEQAVLPAPADRAAVLAEVEQMACKEIRDCGYPLDAGCDFCNGVSTVLEKLRGMADEAQQAGPKRTPMDPVHILGVDSEDPDEAAALRARLMSRPTPAARVDEARQADTAGEGMPLLFWDEPAGVTYEDGRITAWISRAVNLAQSLPAGQLILQVEAARTLRRALTTALNDADEAQQAEEA